MSCAGVAVLSCGLLVSLGEYDTDPTAPGAGGRFAVRGTVDGLDGAIVTLLLNEGNPVVVQGDGAFRFPPLVLDGAGFAVKVASDPADHVCASVTGTIAGHDVTDVAVHCFSTDATLKDLQLSVAQLNEPFSSALTNYTAGPIRVSVLPGHEVTTTVTATPNHKGASITIAGAPPVLGTASATVGLVPGRNTIDVLVTPASAPTKGAPVRYSIAVDGRPNDFLKASNAALSEFGMTVALSGDTLIVGAPYEASKATGVNGDQSDQSTPAAGAVYVFTRSGPAWSQQAYIKASNTRAGAAFGYSVAISGDTLVVGSQGEKSNATGVDGDQTDSSLLAAGAAYVFTRTGTSWSQQAYLKASNTRDQAYFGDPVAISGDTIAVGSPGETSNGIGINGSQAQTPMGSAGAVYVFTRSGTTWSQQAYVKPSNTVTAAPSATEGMFFGGSVALSADTLVVGAAAESSSATDIDGNQNDHSSYHSGAAYVFERNAANWSQKAYIKASNSKAGGGFGGSVALSGDTIVVGSSGEANDVSGVNGSQSSGSLAASSGAAYVFVRAATSWSQQAYLKASNTRAGTVFGYSVAIAGDSVVVGSRDETSAAKGVNGDQTDQTLVSAGAAYLFVRAGTDWSQRAYLKASNTEANANFGCSAALSLDTLVIGAYGDASNALGVNGNQNDTSAPGSGAVYVFF
jgi:hypothetical protein